VLVAAQGSSRAASLRKRRRKKWFAVAAAELSRLVSLGAGESAAARAQRSRVEEESGEESDEKSDEERR